MGRSPAFLEKVGELVVTRVLDLLCRRGPCYREDIGVRPARRRMLARRKVPELLVVPPR